MRSWRTVHVHSWRTVHVQTANMDSGREKAARAYGMLHTGIQNRSYGMLHTGIQNRSWKKPLVAKQATFLKESLTCSFEPRSYLSVSTAVIIDGWGVGHSFDHYELSPYGTGR